MIYTTDGKFLRNVENHISRSDESPELVKLAPGSYTLEARSANDGYVRVAVVIKQAHLYDSEALTRLRNLKP